MKAVEQNRSTQRAAVLALLCALQLSCAQMPGSRREGSDVETTWVLDAALAPGSETRPEELWLFLRSRSQLGISMVCADSFALKIGGRVKAQPIGLEARCNDFANFTPVPTDGTLTVRLPSTAVREDSSFDGLSLVIVEGSWMGNGREYREVHWTGSLEELKQAGVGLFQRAY